MAAAAAVRITWKDALATVGPVLLPMLVGATSALVLTQYRIGQLETQVANLEAQIQNGILPVAQSEIAALNHRMDKIENHHDEIIHNLIRAGSGYTSLPAERN